MYQLTSRQFFETKLPALLKSAPIGGPKGLVEFTIEGDGGSVWWVDFGARTVKKAEARVDQTPPAKFAALVRAQERDFVALVEGRMSPADGLLTQRLHLAGDAVAIGQLTEALAAYAATAT